MHRYASIPAQRWCSQHAWCAVVIINGKIESIRDKPPSDKYYTLIDYGDAVISPGVIDVHAHFNEPGREDWEGKGVGCPCQSTAAPRNVQRVFSIWTAPFVSQQQIYHQMHHCGTHQALHDVCDSHSVALCTHVSTAQRVLRNNNK